MTITPLHDPYLPDKKSPACSGSPSRPSGDASPTARSRAGVKIGGCRRWRLSELKAVRKRLEAEAVS